MTFKSKCKRKEEKEQEEKDGEEKEDELKKTKKKTKSMIHSLWKNVILLSFSFLLLFTAFQSMANLQSSLNKTNSLGIYSLSVIYGSLVFSSLCLPSLCIQRLGTKSTMSLSMLTYSLYIAAQFSPSFGTLIPAGVLVGLGAAPMWSAKCSYLTQMAGKYAQHAGCTVESAIVLFFGVFFLFFQASNIIGNIISSTVLGVGKNSIILSKEEVYENCGLNYCPSELIINNSTNSSVSEVDSQFQISSSHLMVLSGVYLSSSLLAVIIIVLFLDPISKYIEKDSISSDKSAKGFKLLTATLSHMTQEPLQLLIIPLTIWSGLEQGFFGADFTAGYVTCVIGVEYVGYVLIVYGLCDAIGSASFGFLISWLGRPLVFSLGAIINFSVLLTLLTWTPDPFSGIPILFILGGFWGISDAVWQTQINALYGVLFPGKESVAFANYRLWESLGFILAYILQGNVCIGIKVWILLSFLLFGMIGYLLIEIIERSKNNRMKNELNRETNNNKDLSSESG